MQKNNSYDLVVIGGGPAGYSGAIRAAQYGMHVALVESREIGGTCLNRGCIPTKALLHTAQLFAEINHADLYGIEVADAKVNLEKVYARRDEVVAQLRDGVAALVKANKIDLYAGAGNVTDEKAVAVSMGDETVVLMAKNILVATGSSPSIPPIPGSDLPGVLDSDGLLASADDFGSLTVVGGGVIGLEFASVFSALGKTVTIIEMADRILPNMDREIAQNLTMILKKRGVAIFTGAAVQEIVKADGGLSCNYLFKDKPESVIADRILIATGRRANAAGILPDSFGIDVSRGIPVNAEFMTDVSGIYAAGDVRRGNTGLAHMAAAEAEFAVAIMADKKPETILSVVPACVYTEPEIATIGLTEADAKEQGIDVKTGKYVMGGNARTLIEDGDRGFIKLVVDAANNRLLGAQMMCGRATDLIAEAALAIANGITAEQLLRAMRPHPTFAEGITEAAASVFGKAIHIMPKR